MKMSKSKIDPKTGKLRSEKTNKVVSSSHKEDMDLYTAVFNCEDSDLKFAKAEFVCKFGLEVFNKMIQPCLDKGIMSIFKAACTEESRYYVETVAASVNK